MTKRIFLIVLLLAGGFFAQAQFNGILNKVKNKAKDRADKKIDNEIDKTLDKAEGKSTPSPAGETSTSKPSAKEPVATKAEEDNAIKSYSRFDFIPGDSIIYTEDFQQDEIGEFPLLWNTGGKGEVVTLNSYPGKWLRMYENSSYLTGNKKLFSENFTMEFDIIFHMKNTGYTYPMFSFGFLSSSEDSTTDNKFLDYPSKYQAGEVLLRLGAGNTTYTAIYAATDNRRTFTSDQQEFANLEKFYGKVSHVAVQVQGSRFRVWVNGEKKYDLPKALATKYIFNQLYFKLTTSSYNDDELGFYLGNIKVATGKPDTRHKLVEEGKFSTTGILFDFQSAVIKPESYGVVKEIAGVLKDNAGLKIKVIGHTSSDGDDNANMELSKKRAAAVKDLLAGEFGIDASRIETEGKGETQPIADNKTKEGKAANRRVEFIKL
ncbi:MAG: OmpA family protein [Chitinophagaceae bacterium]|nr:OmpA family protein [Chitinophagaceae bacterium]